MVERALKLWLDIDTGSSSDNEVKLLVFIYWMAFPLCFLSVILVTSFPFEKSLGLVFLVL